ncbi:MAG: DUF2461 domain-containing protein [Bacteroidota bacterium]
MLTQESLDFLKDLTQNNNREWFHSNKKRYENHLKKPFVNLVGAFIERFQQHDPGIQIAPKDAIFRINRDIRFSKDKSPYKTNVSAIISPKGRKGKEYPGFYLHIERGRLMMGGGAYFMEKDTLYQLRQSIIHQLDRFQQLYQDPTFQEKFEEGIQGDKNKRLPKEFQEAAAKEPYVANKQFYYMAELDPKHILQDDFLDFAESYYLASKPFNDFLVEGMGMG